MIVCHNLNFFKLRQIRSHLQKLGSQIKKKKILRNFLFFGISENFFFQKIMTYCYN